MRTPAAGGLKEDGNCLLGEPGSNPAAGGLKVDGVSAPGGEACGMRSNCLLGKPGSPAVLDGMTRLLSMGNPAAGGLKADGVSAPCVAQRSNCLLGESGSPIVMRQPSRGHELDHKVDATKMSRIPADDVIEDVSNGVMAHAMRNPAAGGLRADRVSGPCMDYGMLRAHCILGKPGSPTVFDDEFHSMRIPSEGSLKAGRVSGPCMDSGMLRSHCLLEKPGNPTVIDGLSDQGSSSLHAARTWDQALEDPFGMKG